MSKATKVAAKSRQERIKSYRAAADFYRDLCAALHEAGEPTEAQIVGKIARQFGGLERHVRNAIERETACCWKAVSFGSCECGTLQGAV